MVRQRPNRYCFYEEARVELLECDVTASLQTTHSEFQRTCNISLQRDIADSIRSGASFESQPINQRVVADLRETEQYQPFTVPSLHSLIQENYQCQSKRKQRSSLSLSFSLYTYIDIYIYIS